MFEKGFLKFNMCMHVDVTSPQNAQYNKWPQMNNSQNHSQQIKVWLKQVCRNSISACTYTLQLHNIQKPRNDIDTSNKLM